jgi:hypothetical protein
MMLDQCVHEFIIAALDLGAHEAVGHTS